MVWPLFQKSSSSGKAATVSEGNDWPEKIEWVGVFSNYSVRLHCAHCQYCVRRLHQCLRSVTTQSSLLGDTAATASPPSWCSEPALLLLWMRQHRVNVADRSARFHELAFWAAEVVSHEYFWRSLAPTIIHSSSSPAMLVPPPSVVGDGGSLPATGFSTRLVQQVRKDFGSVTSLCARFIELVKLQRGQGWVWLLLRGKGSASSRKLELVTSTDAQSHPFLLARDHSGVSSSLRPTSTSAATGNGRLSSMAEEARSLKGREARWRAVLLVQQCIDDVPLFACDVWEHAYLSDYGVANVEAYACAFWRALDWGFIERQYNEALQPLPSHAAAITCQGEDSLSRSRL